MSSEWTSTTLGEFCPFFYGKGLPERNRRTGTVPVISSAGIIGDHNEALVKTGGIVIGRKGTVGSVTLSKKPFWAIDTAFFIADEPQKRNLRFTYYLLKTLNLPQMNSDSAVPGLNRGNAHALSVNIPSLPLQRKISSILGALDDRILLLRNTNVTLETIAQALFKSWFVDFDPVRAKVEGREPEGIDAETAALFPDSFEETKLGLAPKGWKILRIADVVDIIKGKSYSSKDLVNEFATALVTLKSFARGGGFRLDGFKPYSGSYKPTQIVVPGDLIIAYTDVTQAAELIGKPAIVVGLQEFDTLVASLDVGIVRPKVESISKQFLYGLFKTGVFQAHTLAHTSGTTVLHLSKDAVGSFVFICPDRTIMDEFTTITEVITTQNQIGIDKIRTLTSLRDTLLPRLISGRLRLPEAEEIIEAHL